MLITPLNEVASLPGLYVTTLSLYGLIYTFEDVAAFTTMVFDADTRTAVTASANVIMTAVIFFINLFIFFPPSDFCYT